MKSSYIITVLLLLYSSWSQAQTQLLRQPTISQDHIAFTYANDLWLVAREGGQAQRLTTDEGAERNPHFSPDGGQIAFTAQYDGNVDVYVMPTQGGEPRRLTWHPGTDEVQGWTPDGTSVLFRSGRKGRPTQLNKLYTVSLEGGLPEALPVPRAAYGELSADGRHLAYTPITFWDPEWRNYRGGQAMPIWIVNMDNLELQRTPQPTGERHLDPVWHDGKVYFLSERDYTMNIWSFDPETKDLQQVTRHTQFDVKSLDATTDAIVYEQGGYLHLLDPVTGKAQPLDITVRADLNRARPRWEPVSGSELNHPQISPTGKRALFEYRGDIFTVPKEYGSWRAITNSSDAADRYPIWSPDGQQIAWFSDASGEYTLMVTDQKGLEEPRSIALPNPTFYYRPLWSPDGNHIAYTDTDFNLWYVELESGEATKVDTDRYAHPNRTLQPVWSPDSKWIAYAKQQDNHFKAVYLHDLSTGQSHQVTDDMADAITPVWDASGKYLYFLASTNYGLNTGWLDMSSYDPDTERNLYVVMLEKGTPSPFLLRSDEEENEKEEEKKDENSDSVAVNIDLDNIRQRIVPAAKVPSGNYAGLRKGPKNSVFIMEAGEDGPDATLHKYDVKERKLSSFLSPVRAAVVSADRKQLLFRSGSDWGIVSTGGESQKTSDGQLSIGIRKQIHPKQEYMQMFREGWRFQRDYLYVDNMHGAPWDTIYQWYKPWVDDVRHRSDLNYILDIVSGEVSVGHSYTGGGDYPEIDRVPIGLLGADYETANGYYRIEKIYTGESWNPELEAPLAVPGLDIAEGDYLLAVNGQALTADENIYRFFEATAGRPTALLVNDQPSKEGARLVTVEPISNESALRRFDWIENNRRRVEELSDGKLAYVYVPNTGAQGFEHFNRYYFSQQDKEGVIIDERNNGGGSAADYMIDIMDRQLFGYFNSKAADRRPWTTPMAGIFGPKVMIINERAGSGGDLLPYMFREAEIGPLVGTRTWGGLVGIWDTPRFIDGGYMLAPRGGFFSVEGQWAVEGEGIAPDIEVIQDPAKVAKGQDPQLQQAVEVALKLLPEQKLDRKAEPAPPVRWRRAQE